MSNQNLENKAARRAHAPLTTTLHPCYSRETGRAEAIRLSPQKGNPLIATTCPPASPPCGRRDAGPKLMDYLLDMKTPSALTCPRLSYLTSP
jgi:hypothetical protein